MERLDWGSCHSIGMGLNSTEAKAMKKLPGILCLFIAISFTCPRKLSAADYGTDQPSESRVLTLQDAVRMALAHSPQILLAKAQTIRASEAVRESRSLNRPQLYTGTGLAYNNGFPLSIEGSAPSIFQIGASQPILNKKNANLIREAEESVKASRLGTESARNDLVMKTATVYYELYRARRVVDLATAQLDAVLKQMETVESLLEAGKARPVDATLAGTAVNSARQQLLVAREEAMLAVIELKELTGLPDSISIKTLEPQIDSPAFEQEGEALFREALEHTPEILQAEANLRAKEFHVEAEKGERRPRMEIISEYALFSRSNHYEDYFNRFTRNNYLLGLSIQVPLFDGFRTSARVAQSRQEVTEEQCRLQRIKSDLKLDIQRGLSALRIARGASDLARSDMEAAMEMVQVNETLLQSGRISSKDFEETRLQLQQKESAQLEADQALFQRKLEFLRTIGSLAAVLQ
jgi:outer membrane protein